MEEFNLRITIEIYTECRESMFDPIVWDFDSLTLTDVGKPGISFTEHELHILLESISQIKPISEDCWHRIILERKELNNGLSMPSDQFYDLAVYAASLAAAYAAFSDWAADAAARAASLSRSADIFRENIPLEMINRPWDEQAE